MAITTTSAGLLRLLQLSSSTLPVGGYSFSQGLESACELGWVTDLGDAQQWLQVQIEHSLQWLDIPVLLRGHQYAAADNTQQLQYWNDYLLASRETDELYLAETAMGQALARLLNSLEVPHRLSAPHSFLILFAVAAQHWQVEAKTAALGYAWSWLENQIAAATKLVPLGQTQAQQLSGKLQQIIPECVALAMELVDDQLGAGMPGVSIASSLHEHQYSRLFRS